MMRSLYSGVSGLTTHQTKMDVIGNNIANVNTVAFKSSSVTFQDLLYENTSNASGATDTVGGRNANQIGLGVMTGSTKVSISSGGSAETTGEAFDIKLTDAQNTNFFVVSNGTENLFTRAGSFYCDGNGNLAMTTTGYMVQGWQATEDPETGVRSIVKDTVSPLRIMSAANQTSDPEATTNAMAKGIIDKNSSAFTDNTQDGYIMSLQLYDKLGYSYTAKFSVKQTNASRGEYTVNMTSLVNNSDTSKTNILTGYIEAGNNIGNIFGNQSRPETVTKSVAGGVTSTPNPNGSGTGQNVNNGSTLSYTSNGTTYSINTANTTIACDSTGHWTATGTVTPAGGTATNGTVPLADFYGMTDAQLSELNAQAGGTADAPALTITANDPADGTEGAAAGTLTANTTEYYNNLKFDPTDGSFTYVGAAGQNSVPLNLNALNQYLSGDNQGPFEQVQFDFSQVKNLDNNKVSTLSAKRGAVDGSTGLGKKLGTLTGVSVDSSGQIFGSYSNGNTSLLGQIAVAQFANPSGLEANGDNTYSATLNSGEFDGIGVDISADGGQMTTGELEMSNVDLSREFTEMITTQRGFQANSRIITVSDGMLEELVNLKRS